MIEQATQYLLERSWIFEVSDCVDEARQAGSLLLVWVAVWSIRSVQEPVSDPGYRAEPVQLPTRILHLAPRRGAADASQTLAESPA